jgi:radical SAM superfamily enzyme YgiQ (UPF0313 family)
MKVLLVIPRRDYDPRYAFSKFPDELFTIAAVLEKAGHEVVMFDTHIDRRQPKDFVSFNPDVIGFTVVTSYQITSAIVQSKEFKKIMPGVKIIWGHMHPSMMPEQTVVEPYIDYVAVGGGEYTLLEVVNHLRGDSIKLSEIKGLVYKENGNVVFNEPRPFPKVLDELPDPAWHLVDVSKYWEMRLTTGRGCPWDCGFCSVQSMYKGYLGDLSAERIVWQMERLKKEYGAKYIWFSGENFAFNHERLQEYHDLYNRKNLKLRWCAEVSDMPSEEDIILMANSGCDKVKFCVENGSQRILDFMNKKYIVEDIEKTFWLFIKHRIVPTLFVMYALPTETIEDFKKTHQLLERLDHPPYMYMKFVPYPGARLYDFCVANNLVSPPQQLSEWADFPMEHATKINLSNVPQEMVDQASINFKKTFAMQRIRFSMRHKASYFWKILRDPVGFYRDMRNLIKYTWMVLIDPKMPAKAGQIRPQLNPQENPKDEDTS